MCCKKFSFHQQAVQCKIMQFWQVVTQVVHQQAVQYKMMQFWQVVTPVFSVHNKKCGFHQQAVHVL